jgi:DNA mismatch endonuclease Vsr
LIFWLSANTTMDKLSKEQRRKNMQAVKNKGSKIERMLAKELWNKGYRYRLNMTSVYGKPDICFKGLKIAIFCDSEFWHGKDWNKKKKEHKSNIEFWHQKIERNMQRDLEVNEHLSKNGWLVLRFWGRDIEKDLVTCVNKIEEGINERKKAN